MDIEGCHVPDELRVDVENGVWVRLEPDGSATLGLLAPYLAFAGRLISVSFRAVEGIVPAGRSLGLIESVRLTAPIRTPVDAEVLERNEALRARPRLAQDAPYTDGWFARLRPLGPLEVLPTAPEARAALATQIAERRVRCYVAAPDVEVYEIGAECRAILARLDEELGRRDVGDVVLLVVDDPTAPIEMERWSDRTGYPIVDRRRADGLYHFLIRKVADPRPRRRGEGAGTPGP